MTNLVYKYTDTELKQILDEINILIDTREKKNEHITKYFDSKAIKYKDMKLNYGDYSLMVPAIPELGIMRDMYFNKHITIERKGSLEELSGNFTEGRDRFENELLRAKDTKVFLLIENAAYEDIINHKYKTDYNPKSFLATIKTFENRYGLNVNFVKREYAGNFIYYSLYYFLRNYLKS